MLPAIVKTSFPYSAQNLVIVNAPLLSAASASRVAMENPAIILFLLEKVPLSGCFCSGSLLTTVQYCEIFSYSFTFSDE
jgi:hypothetical protein